MRPFATDNEIAERLRRIAEALEQMRRELIAVVEILEEQP